MPTLIDRFQNLFRPRAEQVAPVTNPLPPARPSALGKLLATERDRRSVVADCRAMYEQDPRAHGVIATLASDAVRGGFDLVVEGPRAEEAKRIAEEMLERVDFWKQIETWARLTLRDGDTFLELGAAANGDLVQVTRKPTLEMYRLSDEFDTFVDPTRAYCWTDQLWGAWSVEQGIPPGAVTFAEWQVIHARWDHDEGSRYGRPLFAAARSQYKRMTEGEFDVAIRRKTRAGMKYLHALKDASDAEMEAYRLRNQDAINDPFAAVADFFSNRDATIQAIQGDANLSDIEDVLHHIRTWWIVSPVPMSLLGYGQDLNRDVLDEQKQQYDLAKEKTAEWVTEQIVAQLIETQWLLKGIWPAALTWSAEWMGKDPMNAASLAELGKALATLRTTGLLTDETLLRMFSRFVPGFDMEAELKALQGQMADEMARVAASAAEVARGEGQGASDGQPQPPAADGQQPPAAADGATR